MKVEYPELKSLFVGTWEGTGEANWPSIVDTSFTEKMVIEAIDDKEILLYTQHSYYNSPSRPHVDGTHAFLETGFISFDRRGRVQMNCSQWVGRSEVVRAKGPSFLENGEDFKLVLDNVGLINTEDVQTTRRTYTFLDENTIMYEIGMATVKHPEFQTHIKAELKRL